MVKISKNMKSGDRGLSKWAHSVLYIDSTICLLFLRVHKRISGGLLKWKKNDNILGE